MSLLFLVVLGAGLRVFRLADQSVWQDEGTVLIHFHAPDLAHYLALIDSYIPVNMKAPLYYVLQYYFAGHVTDSVLALRLVTVTLGVLCIPVLYVLVRRMFGSRAAFFAALLLALSPQHVWFSQEVRNYPFSLLLVLLSLYFLFRAAGGGGCRWWVLSLVTNAVIPWAHLLFSVAIFGQGCFLVWKWRRRPSRVVVWAAVQFALLLPMVISLFPIPWEQDPPIPIGAGDVARAFFGSDSVNLYGDLMPPWKTAPLERLPAWASVLLPLRTSADLLLQVFFAVVLAAVLLCFFRRRGREGDDRPLSGLAFALAVWVAPVALMTLLNLATGKRFLSLMYIMHATFGAYALAGWMVSSVRGTWARRALSALVVSLYLFNLAIFLPFTTREDWKGMVAFLNTIKAPGDVIVNLEFYGPLNPLVCYQDEAGLPILHATTWPAACETVMGLYDEDGGAPPGNVWITYRAWPHVHLIPDGDPWPHFREALEGSGLDVRRHFFPGHYNVTLLEVSHPAGRALSPLREDLISSRDDEYRALLDTIGYRPESEADRENAVRVFRRFIGLNLPDTVPFVWVVYAFDLVCCGQDRLAESLVRWQLEKNPQMALYQFAWGVVMAARGNVGQAAEAFETSWRLQPSLRLLTSDFVSAYIAGDYDAAREELERMRSWGWAYYLSVFDHLLQNPARSG